MARRRSGMTMGSLVEFPDDRRQIVCRAHHLIARYRFVGLRISDDIAIEIMTKRLNRKRDVFKFYNYTNVYQDNDYSTFPSWVD